MLKKLGKKIVRQFANTKILKKVCRYSVSMRNGVILYNTDPERIRILSLIRRVEKENEMLLREDEACQIYTTVVQTKKIDGDIAEVGVYKGGSAKLICEAKGDRQLHLFDTFEGLPEISGEDNPNQFYKGRFIVSFEDVKNSLKKYSNVYWYKGFFPATADPIKEKRFSFVHLDVDIYESTLACLRFFYPRINAGGGYHFS